MNSTPPSRSSKLFWFGSLFALVPLGVCLLKTRPELGRPVARPEISVPAPVALAEPNRAPATEVVSAPAPKVTVAAPTSPPALEPTAVLAPDDASSLRSFAGGPVKSGTPSDATRVPNIDPEASAQLMFGADPNPSAEDFRRKD